MSYDIGKAAINLQWTERVARTEFMDNWEVVRHFSGKNPRTDGTAWRDFYDAIHLDYLWNVNDGLLDWGKRGRITDMGHAEFMEGGVDFRESKPCPFNSPQEVLDFHAVREYGLPDFDETVAYYENWYQESQRGCPNQVISGGYYKTIVSGAIQAFGWDMLLEAAGEDSTRFGRDVLGSIFELSLFHFEAWAKTSIDVFMCHDDMVWTEGPFMHPDFYREYIFPRYKKLWKPLRDAGKRILYTSDGTYDMFLDDLAEAGADGFCFEPTNDLNLLVNRYGQSHVLIGGADCRTLTFGNKDDIAAELEDVFARARGCPGFIFVTGNHFPANIPMENALYYFELIEQLGKRDIVPAQG